MSTFVRRLRAALSVGLLAGVLLSLPVTAAAHTELIGSSPAADSTVEPPATVELTFTEAVQAAFVQVAVLDAAQGHYEVGMPTVDGTTVRQPVGALPAGTYTTSYRVVSGDEHPVTGTFTFTVIAPPPAATAALPAATDDDEATPTNSPVTAGSTAEPTAAAGANEPDAASGLPAWAIGGIVIVIAAGVAGAVYALARKPQASAD